MSFNEYKKIKNLFYSDNTITELETEKKSDYELYSIGILSVTLIIISSITWYPSPQSESTFTKLAFAEANPLEKVIIPQEETFKGQAIDSSLGSIQSLKSYDLHDIPIEKSEGFKRGTCPTSVEDINDMTLLSPINKRDSIKDYVPPNLVEIQNHIKTKGGRRICLEETTAIYLEKLSKAMKEDLKGKTIIVTSGYRSPQVQLYLYNNAISTNGFKGTLRVAPPFHSEHHLNAVDMTSTSNKQESASGSFASTPEGRWMKKNGWKYGFIQSYTKGKEGITGYMTEDWHWRFVGIQNAKLISDTGLTFHELITGKETKIITKDNKKIQARKLVEEEIGG